MANVIKECIAPAPKGGYEAFYYEWRNITKVKNYGGKKKGFVGDGYSHSSESNEMNEDFQDMSQEWEYHVLHYGTADEITNLERKILKSNDARRSPNWYNLTNGGSAYKVAPTDLIKTIVENCKANKYLVCDANGIPLKLGKSEIAELLKGKPIQVRINNSDPKMNKLIQVLIDDKGDTSNTDPLILIEGVDGHHRLLNGNTTANATLSSKHGKYLEYQVIPYELIKNCSDNDLRAIGLALNPKPLKPSSPSTTDDAAVYILEEYRKNKRPVTDISNVEYLRDMLNFNSSQRSTVFAEVNAQIKSGNAAVTTPIIRYAAPQNKHLLHEKREYFEKNINDVKVFDFSSSIVRYNDIVSFLMTNDLKKKNKLTQILIVIHHPTYRDRAKWDKKDGSINRQRMESLCSKYGLTFLGFEYMPMI